jgi:hypothetical protein
MVVMVAIANIEVVDVIIEISELSSPVAPLVLKSRT